MPLFGKNKAGKYDFYLLLHSLSPFPASYRSLYIDWQRGSGKRGQTRSVGPTASGQNRVWATYHFEESLHVGCTLTQDAKSQAGGGQYEKKWLILAIMDGDKQSTIKEPLGRVVINLSDYVADDAKATTSFTVAASKPISADVGECRMLITLGCRSKGKPPMQLGGRPPQQPPAYEQSSGPSSATSDAGDDDVPVAHAPASPPARSQPRQQGFIPHQRDAPALDADGFIIDEEEPEAPSQQQPAWKSVPPGPPRRPAADEAESASDSEDEFLAQAVAAMDRKQPMPKAQPAPRKVYPEASIDSTITAQRPAEARPKQLHDAPVSPFDDFQVTSNFRPVGTVFALKPERQAGRREDKPASAPVPAPTTVQAEPPPPPPPAEPEKPSFLTRPAAAADARPRTTRVPEGVKPKAAPVAQPREPAGQQSSGGAGAGVGRPQRVSKLVSQFETAEPVRPSAFGRGPPGRRDAPPESAFQAPSLGIAPSRSKAAEPLPEAERGIGPKSASSRLPETAEPQDDEANSIVQDRPARGQSRRVLAAERADSSEKGPDSPRRRNLELSRQGSSMDRKSDRAKGVILPTGTVSIRKRPVVSAPADESPMPELPVRTSAPGRHWLDEPEDLGVEPSSPTLPAYQAVAPAPLNRVASLQDRISAAPITSVIPPPSPRARPDQPASTPRSASPGPPSEDLGSPANNPFLQPEASAEAPAAFEPLQSKTSASSRSSEALPHYDSLAFEAIVPPSAPPSAPRSMPPPDLSPSPAPSPPPQQPQPAMLAREASLGPPSNGGMYASGPLSSAQTNGTDPAALERYTKELEAVAALEASVYLVQSRKSRGARRASSKARTVHAPARRLARTTVSLGPEEGVIFNLRALRAIEAAADAAKDIEGRAYWWANCIELRWMLWAVCPHGGEGADADPDSNQFEWVMQTLLPPLRELEEHIFQQLFQQMWGSILMEGVNADQLPGAQPKHWIIPPSREEEAVQRWIDGFQTVHRALLPASRSVTTRHVTLLKQKTLTALMQRLDAAIFERLLADEDGAGTMTNAFSGGRERRSRPGSSTGRGADVPLDARTLPFSPGGPLSFAVGVNLKMAATRWTNWAADIGLRNDKGSPGEGYLLFPKLRATADLLMMPKEVLTDRNVRKEVLPGLQLRVICELLSRFQADDMARDPLPPGLLEALHHETPTAEDSEVVPDSSLASYEPHPENMLLVDDLIEPMVIDMDDESEEELEVLAEMYDPGRRGHTTERFHLLRELWANAH